MKTVALWVRTVGTRAPLPAAASMVLIGLAAHFGWLSGGWLWLATTVVSALLLTIPLAAIGVFVPGETWVERRDREGRQRRECESLAAHGLTPLEYLATIPAGDVLARIEATDRFGVKLRYPADVGAHS